MKSKIKNDDFSHSCMEAIDFACIGMFRCGMDGAVQGINKSAMRILDIDKSIKNPNEVIGRKISDLVTCTTPKNTFSENIFGKPKTRGLEYFITTKKGVKKRILQDSYLQKDPETGVKYVQVVIREIGGAGWEEEIMRKYHDLVDVMIVAIGADQNVNFINDTGSKILGYDKSDIIGKNWFDNFLPKRLRKEVKKVFDGVMSEKSELVGHYRNHVLDSAGHEIVIDWNNICLKDDNGKLIGTLSVGRDISEQQKVEDDIRLHDIRLQSLLDLNKMVGASEEEVMKFVSEEALKITQSRYSFIALIDGEELFLTRHSFSKSVMKRCTLGGKADCSAIKDAGMWAEALRQRKPVIVNDYKASNHLKKGYPKGHVNLKRLLCMPVFEEQKIVALACVANKKSDYKHTDTQAIASMLNDMWRMIQRKRAEEEKSRLWQQLLQSQKLETVGILAGGMAHDFNNLLTGILGYCEIAYSELSSDHPVHRKLKIIENAGRKGAILIRQLLAFSRKQLLYMRLCNLNSIVENISAMLGRVIGEDIKLELNISGKTAPVMVDPTQIEQIMMNLAVNARDAMPNGGRLIIGTKNVSMDTKAAKVYPEMKPGSYVMISVADTGIGMSKEVQRRMFEPFFTTKEKDKGSGLGLSTIFGIVKQHNGYIWVKSRLGKGTMFNIYFPLAKGKIDNMKKRSAIKIKKGAETIMIVDDEAVVRELVEDALKELGYKTITASSGEEALDISDKTKAAIDILITDVVMTGINGWQLSKKIREKRPGIKVIFTSGYFDNTGVNRNIQKSGSHIISKPFNTTMIISKVQEVLSEKEKKK